MSCTPVVLFYERAKERVKNEIVDREEFWRANRKYLAESERCMEERKVPQGMGTGDRS